MTPSIHTLVPDIYDLLKTKGDWYNDVLREGLSTNIARSIQASFGGSERASLRMSKLGPVCPKALWYSVHRPELAEAVPPWTTIKFTYGHVLEALAISLAKAAGHRVEGEQDEINLDGVLGHRDCVVDGMVVDVKSCSHLSFQKFKDKTLAQADTFGYLEQMDAYVLGSRNDPLVINKEKGYFLAIHRDLGHMCTYEHTVREEFIKSRIKTYKEIVERTTAPNCECGTKPDGKSGNVTLDTRAAYSAFKHSCFPSLRTFLYADGPRYLTRVVRRPARQDGTPIPEVDKNGKLIYC